MAVEWEAMRWDWVTPELALREWRERIARVAEEEAAHLASLPYVDGVAVIGSVGRGSAWPLSDVDLLVVARFWEGRDPEYPIREVEEERRLRLQGLKIPNDLEAANWVLLTEDVAAAREEQEEAFLRRLEHPHWLGIVIKGQDARVLHDTDGHTAAFVERCDGAFGSAGFRELWLGRVVGDAREELASAEAHLARGERGRASAEAMAAAHTMTGGAYAVWGKIPQSLTRSVTRFLAAAEEAGDGVMGERFLAAARLGGEETRRRQAAAPPAGQREREVALAIRRGAGEDVDELGVTRDLLQATFWLQVGMAADRSGPYPEWTGVTEAEEEVGVQLEAARGMLGRLESELGRMGAAGGE